MHMHSVQMILLKTNFFITVIVQSTETHKVFKMGIVKTQNGPDQKVP